jgi:proteasome lid subunit RPN8/RPN11
MIVLGKDTMDILLRRAKRHSHIEICGMIWQHPSGMQTVWSLSNMHSQPDRFYTIDPAELKRGYEAMDSAGCTLLAFYHSHPSGKPDPSETDMQGALNEGVHYLIVYPVAGEWRVSAWECIEMGVLVGDEVRVVT